MLNFKKYLLLFSHTDNLSEGIRENQRTKTSK